jgi:hypothetical protein
MIPMASTLIGRLDVDPADAYEPRRLALDELIPRSPARGDWCEDIFETFPSACIERSAASDPAHPEKLPPGFGRIQKLDIAFTSKS